jgi:hypothetical protein
VLGYAIFKQIHWLADRYGHFIFHDVLDIAKLVNALQPFPSGAMQLIKQKQKHINELKNREWQILREPEMQHKIKTITGVEEKTADTDYYDPLAEVNEELRTAEETLKILRSQENKWWSMGFAARFAERYQISEGKADMHNEALRKFFEQWLTTSGILRLNLQRRCPRYLEAQQFKPLFSLLLLFFVSAT